MQDRKNSLPTGRAWSLEYLRIVAAFGIVWFHDSAAPAHWLGLGGLWIFLLISFTLFSRMPSDQPLRAFGLAKARRIMVPWLFWSLFYLVLGLWRLWRHGTPFYEPWMLWTGFSLHLWYLPYLFGASVALHAMRRSVAALDHPAGTLTITVLGLVMLAINAAWLPATPPLAQWLTAIPLTLIGCALGRIALLVDRRDRRVATVAVVACVAAVCAARLAIPGHIDHDAVTVIAGTGVFMLVNACLLPGWAPVRLLSPLTLGVYLIHPFIMDVLVRVMGESGSPLRVALVFAASAAAVYCMRKVPFLRRVV